ncbi:MAG: STT3 domain-containing protein, partial [Arenicellales bacterium]
MSFNKRIDQLKMHLTRNRFSLQEVKSRPRTLILLIVTSYLFAIAVRYLWAMQYRGQPELFWNGYLMLNTTDGYHWAEITHELLTNGYQWVKFKALPSLTALTVDICSCPLEAVMQYLPVFFGSLIVVPLVLIGHALRQSSIGFIAALYAAIAWSYFNRTLPGYFDTDMLNVVFPMFIVWGCIDWLLRKRIYLALLVPILFAGYGLWYPSSASLNSAILLTLLLYTLIFDRRSLPNYKFPALCALAAMGLPLWWKLNGILLLWWFYFGRYSQLPARMVLGVSWLVILLWIGLDFAEPIMSMIGRYGFHTESIPDTLSNISNNVTALDMTLEAQRIPLQDIGLRVSGHIALFFVGGAGYLLLLFRFPVMIVSLPMVALGVSAYFTGLRFTIYAVPPFALGMAFLIELSGRIFSRLKIPGFRKYVYPILIISCTGLVMYPNLNHALTYAVETVIERDEVEALDRLKEISSEEDFVLTWWDFGYPTKYYANRRTLVDGGHNRFDQLFPVGYVLTSENQAAAANMARLSVDDAFQKERPSIRRIINKYGYSEFPTFLSELENLSQPSIESKSGIYI